MLSIFDLVSNSRNIILIENSIFSYKLYHTISNQIRLSFLQKTSALKKIVFIAFLNKSYSKALFYLINLIFAGLIS